MPRDTRAPRRPWRRAHPLAALCAATVLLQACGGDDDAAAPAAPVAVSGVVADGPLQGASVCYDLNDNGACDNGEPGATTDADGKYSFDVAAATAGQHAVLAQVPATAIDKDTGAAVGAAFLLKAPPSGSAGAQVVFVSPLSTVVADVAADGGKTVAEATAQVQAQLGLSVSPLADFTAAGAPAALGQAARAVGQVVIATAKLAAEAGVAAAPAARLVREAAAGQLPVLAAALAAVPAEASPAQRNAAAVAAVAEALNLTVDTVVEVANQVAAPAGPADTASGPTLSVRRFSYTNASNYSYLLFTGNTSQPAADGTFVANEVRRTVADGQDIGFSRNQMYWTGTAWQVCENGWQVVTRIQPPTAALPQRTSYCGGARINSRITNEDISGQTLRAVITRMRAYPLPDSVGSTTDSKGLPVNWGPAPELLPADAVFPAGSLRSARSVEADIGGTDRIELASKSTVRWPDAVYRQATTLEQYSGMPGNLVDAAAVPGGGNTVFVADLPLASQPDATLEAVKRWRAGFDVAALKIRFYQCDLRKADQANLNCVAAGDGGLAISSQGGVRLMRVASGYPAALLSGLSQQRFWAEYAGTVMRGSTDLPRTRYDQRLNLVAWNALRTALAIPAHTEPGAPVAAGPFAQLRNFSFTDAANYSWRIFTGNSSQLDGNGDYVANESRKTLVAGVEQPFVRNRSFWTGSAWYDCPDSGAVNTVKATPPNRSVYCGGYVEERTLNLTLSLDGRFMRDVVNDIRAYGSTDGLSGYGSWGPNPGVHTQLASLRFPEGATMVYRGSQSIATPEGIATAAGDQVRVAPGPTSNAAFDTWAFAGTLDNMVAMYPGSLLGSNVINGNVTLFVWSFTETPSDAAYTNRVEIRVAFDANGNKARFTRNNRLVSNGFSTNFVNLLDTTYSIETVGGVRLLKFAAMPEGFENRFGFTRRFAERNGGVWYAFKDTPSSAPTWSIRLNGPATDALRTALGIQ